MRTIVCIALVTGAAGCGWRGAGGAVPLPSASGVQEYVVPWADAFPGDVAVDSAGRVWFTDRLTHAIGMFDPETEEFRRLETPTPRSTPYGLVAAPDGGLWYAASRAGVLGRVDPATSSITEHRLSEVRGGPHLLAWRDGVVWFTLREGRGYGRYDPDTGQSQVWPLEGVRAYGVAATADAVWIGGYRMGCLFEVDPATGRATEHNLAPADDAEDLSARARELPDALRERLLERLRKRRCRGGDMRRLAAGPDGRILYADFGRGRVVQYAAGRAPVWFGSIEPRSEPYGVTVTRRGHVWYGEKGTGRVVALDPATGERLRINVPTPGGTVRHLIVDEARGRVWLPLSDTGRLGLIELR